MEHTILFFDSVRYGITGSHFEIQTVFSFLVRYGTVRYKKKTTRATLFLHILGFRLNKSVRY